VSWLAKTVLTDEERVLSKSLALELIEIRRQLNELSQVIVMMNDKQFFKALNGCKEDFTENQVDTYKLALQKKADAAEYEFR
jgi:hypothetical protein